MKIGMILFKALGFVADRPFFALPAFRNLLARLFIVPRLMVRSLVVVLSVCAHNAVPGENFNVLGHHRMQEFPADLTACFPHLSQGRDHVGTLILFPSPAPSPDRIPHLQCMELPGGGFPVYAGHRVHRVQNLGFSLFFCLKVFFKVTVKYLVCGCHSHRGLR